MADIDTPDDFLHSGLFQDTLFDDWAGYSQITLSELASRLNAKQHYDNRGRLVWSDGFEETTVNWTPTLGGTGTIARSTDAAWRGAASVLFSTQDVAGDSAEIERHFYNPMTGRYGFEAAWSSGNNDFVSFMMQIFSYDGGFANETSVRVNGKTGQYQYRNSIGAWVNIGQAVCQLDDIHYWHKWKVVFDDTGNHYVRVLLDGYEHDLSNISCARLLGGGCPHLSIHLELVGDDDAIYTVHADDVIFTHLEP